MDNSYYKKYEPIFNSWYIKKFLGEGSFGKVFEIQKEEMGVIYKAALKVITVPQNSSEIKSIMADGMTREEVTEYFKRVVWDIVKESVLMSKLKGNSNIVSYEDHMTVEHEDDIGWDILIKMELLTPLLDHAAENVFYTYDVIKMGIDICKALELCEKNNIVHRDVKPENIFISDNGDYKLGDFGIARTIEQTITGMSKKGTYTYMAPEIYRGEPYGPSVDIYSLGIVMYRFLNGNRAPFLPAHPTPITYETRELALIERIKGTEIPKPKYAEEPLSGIILKACAYDPNDRYESASEFRTDLERAMRSLESTDHVIGEEQESVAKTESTFPKIPSKDFLEEEGSQTESAFQSVSREDYRDKSGGQGIFAMGVPVQDASRNEKLQKSGGPKEIMKGNGDEKSRVEKRKIDPKRGTMLAVAAVIITIGIVTVVGSVGSKADNAGQTTEPEETVSTQQETTVAPEPVELEAKDSSEIINALNSAGNGDTIYIDTGSYAFDGPLTIHQDNLTIIGRGEGKPKIDCGLYITGSNVTIENLSIDIPNSEKANERAQGIKIENLYGGTTTLRDVDVKMIYPSQLILYGLLIYTETVIEGCTIDVDDSDGNGNTAIGAGAKIIMNDSIIRANDIGIGMDVFGGNSDISDADIEEMLSNNTFDAQTRVMKSSSY